MVIDPINDIDNEDWSEVACCRGCRELIEPGTEVDFNDWFWHSRCVPFHAVEGREQEHRADEAANK